MGATYEGEKARARASRLPVNDRLAIVAEACRRFIPEYADAVDRFVERLRRGEAGEAAPRVGDPFPDFALPDQTGRLWRSDRLRAEGPLVVSLHRGAWCIFCQINTAALAEAHPRVVAAGGRLVAVSPQRAAAGARQIDEAGAAFPMLSDVGGGLATQLGLTVPIGEDLKARLAAFGYDIAEMNGDDGLLLPIPATFVLTREGRVAARHIDPDPRVRMDVEAIVQAVADAALRC